LILFSSLHYTRIQIQNAICQTKNLQKGKFIMPANNSLSFAGLNKAAVLAALYNASRAQGKGFIRYDQTPMSIGEAQNLLNVSLEGSVG
jgi:hypothetical protein